MACGGDGGGDVEGDATSAVDVAAAIEVEEIEVAGFDVEVTDETEGEVTSEIEIVDDVATEIAEEVTTESETSGDVVDVADEVADDVAIEIADDVAIEIVDDVAIEIVDDVAIDDGPPEVVFVHGGARTLFFLNNPEQLVLSDLGDAALGDVTLYRVTASGACRSFFEHVNKTGRTIGFGIQVYNPGPGARTIDVRAAGFVASIQGGEPFADALGGAGDAAPIELAAGASTWILRRDEAIAAGAFFSGVVDYDVTGGGVIVNHTAYDAFGGLDGSTSELGYLQRVEPDGTHEARMYKGRASASEVTLEGLAWTVDDATPAGPLPVRVRRYDLIGGAYGVPIVASAWTSHIGPSQNVAATTSDMVSFDLPGWGVFDPLVRSDGEDKYPNLGNWGVIYRVAARVDNEGASPRVIRARIEASPGAGAVIAARAGGGAWSAFRLEAGQARVLASTTVPAGHGAILEVAWVLGGPSGGAIKNEIVLE